MNNKSISAFLKERKPVFLANASRCLKQEVEEMNILSLLAKNDIPAIVIKGNEIAKRIYQDPYCRTSSDIDFLIRESDITNADASLTKTGYIRTNAIPLKFWVGRIHHAVYAHPQTHHLIEIHWNFGIPSYFNLTSNDIWNEITEKDNGGFELSKRMQIIKLIIHHSLHAYKEIKVLVDVLWTIYKYESVIHWRPFALKIKHLGMTKATWITLNQIHTLWPYGSESVRTFSGLHRELNEHIRKPPKLLARYFHASIEIDKIYYHAKDQFFVRFTLDGLSTILSAFIKTLLPRPSSIKDFYNDKRTWMLPINYLKFIKYRMTTDPNN